MDGPVDNVEDKNPVNMHGETPLHLAIESNHSTVLEVLAPKESKKRKSNLKQNHSKAKHSKCNAKML